MCSLWLLIEEGCSLHVDIERGTLFDAFALIQLNLFFVEETNHAESHDSPQ